MKLFDVMTAPWAIVPEKLREIQGVYETHLKGDKIDLDAIEARMGEPLQKKDQGYQVINGTAIISIDGVISRRMNLLQKVSGGASTELIERDVKAALEDSGVERILLEIDSPGGSVSGIFELANLLYNARGDKPIDALSVGNMASAAYLIGAAAENVYISGETDSIGSIGVIYTHLDKSEAQAKEGVKTTEIFAGKYKVIASPNKPLSEEGQGDIQAKVDYIYSLFVEHVAKFRSVSVDVVLADMADGKVFIGKQAIKAGLVDGVSTFDALIASTSAGVADNKQVMTASGVDTGMTTKANKTGMEEKIMDLKEFKADHSVLHGEIVAESRKGYLAATEVEAKVAEGVKAESDRITALDALAKPGREKMIAGFKSDGKTTADQAALQILAYEDEKLKGKAKAQEEDAAAVAAISQVEPGGGEEVVDDSLPVEEKCKAAWETDAKLRAEFTSLEAYTAFERAAANGSAKILKK